ncbi:MAG: tRNA preQ1(34) S-adenosylmethionine ribosyltransferase-isomerase QueA [Bdellovibrionales bacterium]|nr:tRNA preQ1(34) S-adenosylmethionine ribosyltransferase-isomerase QueA [Bdellovibrionales bacterium]
MKPHDLSTYFFDLPDGLVATAPVEPRDASRLLVLDRVSGRVEHRMFRDLPGLLGEGNLCVANNSRVIPARLLGHRLGADGRPGGKIEFLLLEEIEPRVWEGLLRSSAKAGAGFRFAIPLPAGGALEAEVLRGSSDSEAGTVRARFQGDPLQPGIGSLPIPPYMRRAADARDEGSYQTVYARDPGSAAAPTAGLHFTPALLDRLRASGAHWNEVTLHVGLGTFRPVKTEDLRAHVMHEERYEIPAATAEAVTEAKRSGLRVCAVGTTSVRTLESAWNPERRELRAGPGRTRIFLRPEGGRGFQVVDRLITNFHLPGSTLLMLVCAFAGTEPTLAAYREAVRERYRFYSYGDAMLIR